MKVPDLKIRPYQVSDIEASFEAVMESGTEIRKWMPWFHDDYKLEDTIDFVTRAIKGFESQTQFEFLMTDGDGACLGACGLNQIRTVDRVANMGYWVRSSRAGQGIATKAVGQLVDWAFAYTNLVRLEILIAFDNQASRRVAEKLDAHCEGVLRQRFQLEAGTKDAIMYSIVR